jgi:hypothetical protein
MEIALRIPFLALLSAGSLIVGCTAAPTAHPVPTVQTVAVPAYLTENKGCAVLVGGSLGSEFADPKIADFWHAVNSQVANHLYDELVFNKFKVVKLTISPKESPDTERLVAAAMARNRCNRVIQVVNIVNEDAQGRFFKYDISVMRFDPKGARTPGSVGTRVTTVGEFSRSYRYVRNDATFKTFFTGTFASSVYSDLAASGTLVPLKIE